MIFKILYTLLRLLLLPVFYIFILVNKKIKERIFFESKNKFDQNALSFKKNKIIADYLFEVSSEGELEQALPVIKNLLKKGNKIELVFSSDSVEKKCMDLAKLNPDLLRILRFKILTFNPFSRFYILNWATAKRIILVRYDFFPELIFYGMKKDVSMSLIAGTLKNYESKHPLIKRYLSFVYLRFKKIIMATNNDILLFEKIFGKHKVELRSYDFRPIQILGRQQRYVSSLNIHSEALSEYIGFLSNFDIKKKVIFGSFWDDENIFTKDVDNLIDQGFHFAIVPHKLSESDLLSLFNYLKNYTQKPVYEINADMEPSEFKSVISYAKKEPGIFILNIKGVLCELYKNFTHAYVAGGYRLSVHSLLEPAFANCHVYFGPKIHRSTEFDLLCEWVSSNIHLVENPEEVLNTIERNSRSNIESTQSFSAYYLDNFNEVIEWIEDISEGIENA